MFIVVSAYVVIDSVRKRLDTASYTPSTTKQTKVILSLTGPQDLLLFFNIIQ